MFIGIPRGEEFAATLHPLFTTLHHSVSADLLFAAVWVTIADLKSAKRTVARRANSLEADYKSASNRSSLFCLRIANPQERLTDLRACIMDL